MALLGWGFILSFIGIGGLLRPFGWLSAARIFDRSIFGKTGWIGIVTVILDIIALIILLIYAASTSYDASASEGLSIFFVLVIFSAGIMSIIYTVFEVVSLFELASASEKETLKTWAILYIVSIVIAIIPVVGWIIGGILYLISTIGLGINILSIK